MRIPFVPSTVAFPNFAWPSKEPAAGDVRRCALRRTWPLIHIEGNRRRRVNPKLSTQLVNGLLPTAFPSNGDQRHSHILTQAPGPLSQRYKLWRLERRLAP